MDEVLCNFCCSAHEITILTFEVKTGITENAKVQDIVQQTKVQSLHVGGLG